MNIAHIIETALMILVVFLIGAILGYLIRHLFFRPQTQTASPATSSTATNSPATSRSATSPVTASKVVTAPAARQTTAPKPTAKAKSTSSTSKITNNTTNITNNTTNANDKPETLSKPRDGKKDDLKRIKGIGPKIEKTLNELGIYHLDQIAKWSPKTVEWINTSIKFKDRIQREKWIEQAKKLAAGKDTEFSRRVDRGAVPSSKK